MTHRHTVWSRDAVVFDASAERVLYGAILLRLCEVVIDNGAINRVRVLLVVELRLLNTRIRARLFGAAEQFADQRSQRQQRTEKCVLRRRVQEQVDDLVVCHGLFHRVRRNVVLVGFERVVVETERLVELVALLL